MAALSREYNSFLTLLQAGLGMNADENAEVLCNESVFKESVLHSVAGLSYSGLSKLGLMDKVEPKLLAAWKSKAINEYMFLEGLFRKQQHVIEIFNENNIKYAILKGISIGKEYESANLRMQSDIDVLVKKSDLKKAANLLLAKGYAHVPGGGDHHITLNKGNITIEVHHILGGLPDKKVKRKVEKLFDNFHKKLVETNCNGYAFTMLPTTLQATSLLLHLIQHMTRAGSGFRQVCDWALFAKKNSAEVFSGECEEVLKGIGIFEFARIMTAFCNLYLNAEIPCDFEIPEEELEPLLEDVFASGEFGYKDVNRGRSRFLISANSGGGFKKLTGDSTNTHNA